MDAKPLRWISSSQLLDAHRVASGDPDRITLPEDLIPLLESKEEDWPILSLDFTTTGRWLKVTVEIEDVTFQVELPPEIHQALMPTRHDLPEFDELF